MGHLVWNVDPELVRLGPFALRWYGLLFASGFLFGYYIALSIYRRENRPENNLSSLFTYIFLGTLIGARLGQIVLYEPEFYLTHPWEIVMVWHGGLASHGGFVGVLVALWLYVRKYRDIGYLELADRLAVSTLVTASFIRLGNFFNSEILGRPSDAPWAVVFLRVDNIPRHPVVLYEALAYAIVAVVLYVAYWKTRIAAVPGRIVGIAFAACFGARFLLEFFKEDQIPLEQTLPLNMGQLYSVPFILGGLYLVFRARGTTMKKISAVLVLLLFAAAPARAQKIADRTVVRVDPALDELVSPDAKLELVKGGFGFTEGALWVQQGKSGYLLFSDIPANVIYKWMPDGRISVYLDHSGYTGRDIWRVGFIQTNGKEKNDPLYEEFPMIGSNGLALDRQGRLVIATWAGRSIDRIEKNGKRTVLADRYEGKRFGGTNDLVVKKDGAIYFTDGYGGLRQRENDPKKELDFAGIFMLRDGKVTRIIDDIARPNGLAFSPDEKYLYANGGRDKFIKRYEVRRDGTVANGTMFIDISKDTTPGITDGMRVDSKGNIYETAAGGVWVISPEGKHLGTILTPELAANVEFGDPDRKTLYIAARTSIYKIRVNTPGLN